LVLLVIVSIVAVRRSGSFTSVGVLFGVAALVVVAFAAWNFAEHSILRQRAAEREALDARALQLTTAAIAPGSPLACLDRVAGDAVSDSCEPAVFRSPETVAAATAYAEARLRLLADGFQYAHRFDSLYYNALDELRSSMEADRYGFVAHVLMKRNGCTVDSCFIFGWLLHDTGRVKANMNARTLENNMARYADTWPKHRSSPAAVASPLERPVAAIMSGPVMTKPIDFPTAASIPPVSIMTEPPAAPAPGSAEAAPARRQPAPASAAVRPQ
jgi:hypothetical protein